MKKLIILITSLVISVGVIFSVGFAKEQPKEATAVSTDSTNQKESAAGEGPKFYYDSKGKSDPMDAPWYHKGTGFAPDKITVHPIMQINVDDNLKSGLTGIVYCETNSAGSLAILGNQIVKNGDTVKIPQLPKNVKIVKINRQDIVVLYDGKTYPVKIAER